MSLKVNRRNLHPFLAGGVLLVGLAAGLRAVALPELLPDLDAVNFARALTRFDVAAQAPHFPGYPVYVLLARLAAGLGAPEVLALALPGLVLGALATAALAWALRPQLGAAGALAGAALFALLPLPVLAGGTPGSDGTGLALLALAVAALLALEPRAEPAVASGRPAAALLAGALAGLALGARPSYLPALAALLFAVPRGARGRWVAGATGAALAWALPLLLLTGAPRLLHVGRAFLRGHAGEWGGTVAVQADLGERAARFGWDVLAAGLGLPWAGSALGAPRFALALLFALLLLAVGAAALRRGGLLAGERRVALAALWLGGPYAAWMFVGQNLLKARHALPVVLALALLLAVGAALLSRRLAARPALALPALALLLAVSLPLARAQGAAPAPAAQLVRHVQASLPASGTVLFTGEEGRLFEHYAPQFRAGRPADAGVLAREAQRYARAGAQVYVTSSAPGAAALTPSLVPLARFDCDPLVRSHAHALVLYQYRPGALALAAPVLSAQVPR